MPPESPSASIPSLALDTYALDDIELARCGIDVFSSAASPVRVTNPTGLQDAQAVEPEGVPIARIGLGDVNDDGQSTVTHVQAWLAQRPARPFERLHVSADGRVAPTCLLLVDHLVGEAEVAERLNRHSSARALLLIPIAVEREGAATSDAARQVRRILKLAESLGRTLGPRSQVEVVIAPVDVDHPYRAARLKACADAYSQGAPIEWLLSDHTNAEPGAGTVLFFTGLSGSGKSTLARAVRNRLLEQTDREITLLDGDVIRRHLSAGLGFSADDRNTNILRIGWVAARIVEHQGLVICSPIAPFAETRETVERMVTGAGGRFILIHVATPLAECERRDRKGLYARARAGEIPDFTGISSPYEEPHHPDLRIDTTGSEIEPLLDQIMSLGADQRLWKNNQENDLA